MLSVYSRSEKRHDLRLDLCHLCSDKVLSSSLWWRVLGSNPRWDSWAECDESRRLHFVSPHPAHSKHMTDASAEATWLSVSLKCHCFGRKALLNFEDENSWNLKKKNLSLCLFAFYHSKCAHLTRSYAWQPHLQGWVGACTRKNKCRVLRPRPDSDHVRKQTLV